MSFDPKSLGSILKHFKVTEDTLDDVIEGPCFEALFHYFAGDMPYGTMKARTGDPYDWILLELARRFRWREIL